jgi:hypothetical protein
VQRRVQLFAAILLVLAASGDATPQGAMRRLATVAALHQYPGYYHLQNVLLHGEFVESGARVVLRGGERDITVFLNDNTTTEGVVEVRGQLLDVGRLEPGDPRLAGYDGDRDPDRWPRPGEELVLVVTAITEAPLATTPSVRGLALQPWRFEGQKVTLVGQFRGRNLFGDLPSAPGKSRYDFVLRSADAAVWVTDLRPRGRGFDLSVDARVDTGRWLQITGTVSQDRGLVTIAGTAVATATAPEAPPAEEEAPPPAAPLEPAEVVFSQPYEGEVDVQVTTSVRIQFSRGVDPATIAGQIRVSYVGAASPDAPQAASLEFQYTYDAGTRAIEIKFTQPLDRFRTLRVELMDGLKAFDGAPVRPWTLTFSAGG